MNKQELKDLLKNAECGSEDLTTKVMIYLHGDPPPFHIYNPWGGCTQSVDAALAEIPESLRAEICTTGAKPDVTLFNYNSTDGYHSDIVCNANHKLLPIAILLAIIEAKI